MSGRKSQRKGRGGEREVRDILKAAGWDAACRDLYEPLDLLWGFDGRDHLCEVKRHKKILTWAYKAFKAGAEACFSRADDEEWLVTFKLKEFIRTYGPTYPDKATWSEDPLPPVRQADEAAQDEILAPDEV